MTESATLIKTIEVQNTQMSLKELVSMLFEGAEIILAQNNQPLARLTPIDAPSAPRIPGLHAGQVWMSEDFCEPLPETFWTGDV